MNKQNKFGPKSGWSAPDPSLRREVMRLSTEIANMKFRTRVLEAKIFLMESEYDMLVRMLRTTKALPRNVFTRLENLLDPLYNLVGSDGRINARLTVTRYGVGPEPAKSKTNRSKISNSSDVPGVLVSKGPGEPGTQEPGEPECPPS